MSSTRSPDALPAFRLGLLSLAWCGLVLAGYSLLRDADLRPVLRALGARLLDVAVPLLVVACHLPAAAGVVRLLAPGPLDPRTRLLVTAAQAIAHAMLGAMLAGIAGCFGGAAFAGVPLLLALLCRRELASIRADVCAVLRSALPRLRSFPGCIVLLLLAASLSMALLPAVEQDALHYHLAVPALWLDAGGFCDIPGIIYARFPMHTEMLFATGLALRGEGAARVFHWLCALLAAYGVACLGRRFSSGANALWGSAIFLAVPSVFRVASWAYVEMAGILFLVVAWIVWLEWRTARRNSAWVGFFLGVACGTKYTLLLPAIGLGLAHVARSGRRWLVSGAALLVAALAGGGYWYLRNLVSTGNPVFPFCYEVFGGEGWDAERARVFDAFLRQWGVGGWLLPLRLTFDATFFSIEGFDGVTGPVFLLALPLILWAAVRKAEARATLLLALLLLGCWVFTTHQVRFLLPAFALLAALPAAGWESLPLPWMARAARTAVGAGVLLSLPSHLILFAQDAPLAYAVGLESGDAARERTLSGGDYQVFRAIERVVPPNGRVLFAGSGNPVYLCRRAFHADSVVENHTLRRLLRTGGGATGFARAFAREGFTHLLFRFPLVFGRVAEDGDLTLEERGILMQALNEHGEALLEANGTYLYRLAPPCGAGR